MHNVPPRWMHLNTSSYLMELFWEARDLEELEIGCTWRMCHVGWRGCASRFILQPSLLSHLCCLVCQDVSKRPLASFFSLPRYSMPQCKSSTLLFPDAIFTGYFPATAMSKAENTHCTVSLAPYRMTGTVEWALPRRQRFCLMGVLLALRLR